jgi:DNA adenine methylase
VQLGCYVLLTNSTTEFVRKLYEGYSYVVIDTKRNISSDAGTRTGQDLVVIATKPQGKTKSSLSLVGKHMLENFPGTRYMGSKYRVLPFIWDAVKELHFDSVFDAFSGSACVSYMFKQQGKRVISNDFMQFAYHFSKSLIENQEVILTEKDKKLLLSPNKKADSFISETFAGMYFTDNENCFLDNARANVELLDNEYKKSLALSALVRACMKRRPRGIFTFTGERYNDGRRDMQIDLKQHFVENIEAFNKAVFDNSRHNLAFGLDVFDLNVDVELVYLDPPYFTPKSDNDYTRRYHFVEGLVRQWKGVEIQQETVTKKFKRYETPFYSKDTIIEAFEKMFEKFKNQIIVLSYSSNSIPGKTDLVSLLKRYKKHVKVHQIEHTYSFGNQNHKIGNNANKVNEFVFVAY